MCIPSITSTRVATRTLPQVVRTCRQLQESYLASADGFHHASIASAGVEMHTLFCRFGMTRRRQASDMERIRRLLTRSSKPHVARDEALRTDRWWATLAQPYSPLPGCPALQRCLASEFDLLDQQLAILRVTRLSVLEDALHRHTRESRAILDRLVTIHREHRS